MRTFTDQIVYIVKVLSNLLMIGNKSKISRTGALKEALLL